MGKANILVVEDDAIIVLKLRKTLEDLGYTVSGTADNGKKAIEIALAEKPDLILMDIRLKGDMDGIETTEAIRSHLEVPVIFTTAYGDAEKIDRAKRTLPYGYLLKPIQENELEITIEIALHVARVEAEKRLAEEERKKLQQQLFQAQKMESLGTLAGGIAHDFNNLLFQIMGSIQIVKKRLPESDHSIKNLSNALQAANRAKDLVQQILTFSRNSKSDQKPILIQPIIKEALKLLRASLPTTIEIQQHIDLKAGAIECDQTEVYQLIVNLCTNAFHAMSGQSGILSVSLRENKDNSTLEMQVSDTGCGMKPEVIERIFDPYFTTKDRGEGTGLGLSIVHGIVNKYNGIIKVESEPNVGSTFTICFPLAEPPASEQLTPHTSSNLPTGSERLLVVDDEELIMNMEEEILESLGYSTIGFSNSTDALAVYEKDPQRFDLILTDQTMPKLTGIEFSKRVLSVNPNARIILLSGYSDNLSEKDVDAVGVKRFLMKPLDITKLANTVREVLDE